MSIFFIDIHSKGPFPSNMLSNFAHHTITFDGIHVTSAESFLQSLKTPDPNYQKSICAMDARSAKALSPTLNWKETGMLYWNGIGFRRNSLAYQRLLGRFYLELTKNKNFTEALQVSGHRIFTHRIGKFRRSETCLTTFEFICHLYRVRHIVRHRAKYDTNHD